MEKLEALQRELTRYVKTRRALYQVESQRARLNKAMRALRGK